MSKPFMTRFAPSPTGLLHLGHAYSALVAYRTAKKMGGMFLLRIEDIDTTRCKPEFEAQIKHDLAFLGIDWPEPARRQSDHFDDYRTALARLDDLGLVYPCFCTRKEILKETAASQSAPHGPDGAIYPGACLHLSAREKKAKIAKDIAFSIRLDMTKALSQIKGPLTFREKGALITAKPETLGDVVLARKDTPTSYHLSVVVDDALQGMTHIIRGEDLFHTTYIHRLLQAVLDLPTPEYHHHVLLAGKDGRRFAKRDKSLTLKSLIEEGKNASEIETLIRRFGGSLTELPF